MAVASSPLAPHAAAGSSTLASCAAASGWRTSISLGTRSAGVSSRSAGPADWLSGTQSAAVCTLVGIRGLPRLRGT